MKQHLIITITTLLLGCNIATYSQSSVNLLDNPKDWLSHIPSTFTPKQEYKCWGRKDELKEDRATILDNSEAGRLLVEICTDGKPDKLPSIFCELPNSLSINESYQLRGKIKQESCYSIQDRQIRFNIKDCACEKADTCMDLGTINCGQGVWKEFSLPIENIPDSKNWLEVCFIDNPLSLDPANKVYLDIRDLRLECENNYPYYFDGHRYNKLNKPQYTTETPNTISTSDGLCLAIDKKGNFQKLQIDSQTISTKNSIGGFLIKDAMKNTPPLPIVGNAQTKQDTILFHGITNNTQLEATIHAQSEFIEVSGLLKATTKEQSMLTLYFALPLINIDWLWWENINKATSVIQDSSTLDYRQENHYPLSAITSPKIGGISFAIPMDAPLAYRICYNKQVQSYYIAFDLSLLPETNVNGKDMSAFPFKFIIYKHDPAWGFRSALAKYYEFYPQFFVNRIDNPGGWGVWRTNNNPPSDYLDDGFRFCWGHESHMLEWHKQHGVYNLLYLEPEHYQLSLGDFTTPAEATPQRVLERIQKLGNLDETEISKYRQLSVWNTYGGYFTDEAAKEWGKDRDKEDYWRVMSIAASKAVIFDIEGMPEQTIAGNRAWLGDSQIGSMLSCNLDPDIPGGKGWFNTEVIYKSRIRALHKKTKFDVDGFSLDSFLTLRTPNFRQEHFRYADLPLSFEYYKGKPYPMIPKNFSTIEWLKDLKSKYPDKLMMANLTCCNNFYYLTFAAPYLDIFGIEDRRVDDQEFLRSMAYRKPITDLPYSPRKPYQAKKHLLYAIFMGEGHDKETMRQYFPVIRKLHATGWHPIPYARTKTKGITIERYADKNNFFLVLNNDLAQKQNIIVKLDHVKCGQALDLLSENSYTIQGNHLKIPIDAHDTIALKIDY